MGYLMIVIFLAGVAAGWACTYGWFHRDKIRKQIAGEVSDLTSKVKV